MPRTITVLAWLALVFAAPIAWAQGAVEEVLSYGMDEIEAPSRDPWKAEDWAAKYPAYPIHVRLENGALVLAHWTGKEQRRFASSYRASGTEYIGINRGEFGGGLFAVLPDGERRKLLDENIVSIVPRGTGLLVVSGIAHGDTSIGAVHRIHDAHAKPRLSLMTLLPDAPRVVLEDPRRPLERLLLVGPSSLMSIATGRPGDRLAIHTWGHFWAGLYPNSAVFYREHLVIASSNCVVVAKLEHDHVVSTRYFRTKAVNRLR